MKKTSEGKRPEDCFRIVKGPFAVVRACDFCEHLEKVLVGLPCAGRGYGMREGNKARGRMIQHIKAEHGERFTT